MAQTREGALKTSAKKAGLALEDYIAQVDAGLKRCTRCKTWKLLASFGNDKTRNDGKDSSCFDCRHVKERKSTKGRTSTFKGQSHTEEAKHKISQARKGKPNPRKGQPRTESEKETIRKSVLESQKYGEAHPNYKHGNAQRNLNDRRKPEYLKWRKAVFERDNYTCQKCDNKTGGNLRAHHIKPFAEYPELRFDVSNGVTFCHACHELEHFKPDSIRNQRKLKRGEKLWA